MVVAELVTKLGFQVDPRELSRGINQAKYAVSEFKSFLGKLTLGIGFMEIAKHMVNTGRELETMNIQLTTMIGNSDKARAMFKDIRDYAIHSTFRIKDVMQGANMLLSAGVQTSKIMPVLKMLGDVAGADTERFKGLAFAYNHVAARGYMSGREWNMFAMRGFNPARELALMEAEAKGLIKRGQEIIEGSVADKFIRTKAEEMHASLKNRTFTQSMVDEAFRHATSEGGRFYNNQLNQMNTMTGKWTTFLDYLDIKLGEAAQKLFPLFKKLLDWIMDLPLEWLPEMFTKLGASLMELGHDLSVALGGKAGLLEAGKTVLGLLMTTGQILFWLTKSVLYVIGFVREHTSTFAVLATILSVLAGSTMIAKLGGLTKAFAGLFGFNSVARMFIVNLAAMRMSLVSLLEGNLRAGLNTFLSRTTIGMLGLQLAVMFTTDKLVRLVEVAKEAFSESDRLANMNLVAERSTIEGRIRIARAKLQKHEGPEFMAQGEMYSAQKDLAEFDRKHPTIAKMTMNQAISGGKSPSDELADSFAKSLKETTDSTNKILSEIAGNTKPRRGLGLPTDLLGLSETAFRSSFSVDLQRALIEAEG